MVKQTKTIERKAIDEDDEEDEQEEMVFHIYPQIDNDEGGVELDDVVGEICCDIEEIAASGKMGKENLARYHVITELMAVPMCKLTDKLEEMLQQILEDEMEAGYKELFSEEDEETKEAETTLANGRCSTGCNSIAVNTKPETPVLEEDISDEELIAEFSAAANKANPNTQGMTQLEQDWMYGGYD